MKCFQCSCHGVTIATVVIAAALCLALPVLSKEEEFMPNQPDAIPTFLIIGIAKGGTSDLFAQLTAGIINLDPDRPDPPFPIKPIKELAYLSRPGIDGTKMLPQKQQYMEYLELLGHPCSGDTERSLLQECFDSNATKHYTLDATPMYVFSAVVPLYLRALSGSSKIIMMIREPVERTESLFRHFVLTAGRWLDRSIDDLATDFFKAISTEKGVVTALQRAADCSYGDVVCLANSWRDILGFKLMGSQENKVFAAGLYRYALAVWRYHYFRPGRVLVVDSHVFFKRRVDAMEKIIRFMYGRPMLPSEETLAASGGVHRKIVVQPMPKTILSPPLRQQLSEFYEQHVMRGLFRMLSDMRDEGAWVFGFSGEPWNECPGFEEFNAAGKSKL
ncbi:hypothetical protein Vretimale_12073 [Volvox reticuliferus]|uniref:Sulfotransferase n=1 Tax=Volvox reticuliferus TaxID=1737510 RepID=A0A8J4FP88_9CHLO|nr:hypothetical protein Vretifemale_9552 [Volvox reticuliferus]GIM08015.1 hypothetical protein Vretimale_12073 [Volvox reticuliferus]